eukprot:CAMPEP_0172310914 /NCGR_PEP_ID=MMETSP1058-20130122/13166_1 /TAXON_ID=83371 /ORGANISM="Detonula confervacea, Strain CCMP 353" /LENGTH=151 /DNA_ID=CAMNT_0013023911 /DNA_START=65 /DNA_END=520 /DNA_ORIENTATION=+
MKVFASVLALLFTSSAAAGSLRVRSPTDASTLVSVSHVIKAVSVYNKADPDDEDIPCITEGSALVMCLGETVVDCIVGLIEDIKKDATCADLETDFCPDYNKCMESATTDCTAQGAAFQTCAEAAIKAADPDEEICPADLCETEVAGVSMA